MEKEKEIDWSPKSDGRKERENEAKNQCPVCGAADTKHLHIDLNAALRGSSTAESPAVNRMVASSNLAPGAERLLDPFSFAFHAFFIFALVFMSSCGGEETNQDIDVTINVPVRVVTPFVPTPTPVPTPSPKGCKKHHKHCPHD